MSTYQFKTKPYKHQLKALKRLLKQGYGGALLFEPRTGKTKTTIDWLSILYQQKKIDRAIIVAPNRVLGTWVNEFHIHSPMPVHITVWDAEARRLGVPAFLPGVMNVLILNYEAFATPGRKLASGRRSRASGRFKVRSDLLKWMAGKPTAGVLDESHKIKSPSGRAANLIVTMHRNFAYKVILTGTPITKEKRIFDIYMQWSFLNPARFADYSTVAQFKQRYGVWLKKDGYSKFLRGQNLNELHRRIAKDAIIVRRDHCFDLPPREDIIHYVDLQPRTRQAYIEMAEEMVAKIEDGVYAEAPIKLVQGLRLSQLTSGFITDENRQIHRLGLEKANALQELLEVRFEVDDKVVVVAKYKVDMNLIEDMGKALGVPVWSIRGEVSRRESDDNLVAFRNHEGAGMIVLQPAASSLGIDLSSAAHMIWYSHTPSWVDFTQCCDRIALSRRSTTFTHLVARHSVDEILLGTLAADGDVAKAIMTKPRELIDGRVLDLDESNRIKGLGTFQYNPTKKRR